MMRECPRREQLELFSAGDLPEQEEESVGLHVAECQTCKTHLDEAYALGDAANNSPSRPSDTWTPELVESITRQVESSVSNISTPKPIFRLEIPGYTTRCIIGQGGMGFVWLAWQHRLERQVAIKVLPPALTYDEASRARFAQEIAAVGRLNHPGIVTAYDANEDAGMHYLVMEYVEGKNLSQILQEHGSLGVEVSCEVARQAALALQNAHDHGLIHRDIKLSNLMLTSNGVVKVLDLGLSHLIYRGGNELTSASQVMGTLEYMAPEQADGKWGADKRSDIFSLGATLFKLLTEKTPLESTTAESWIEKLRTVAHAEFPSISVYRDDLPKALVDAIDRMLHPDPSSRFDDLTEVAAILGSYTEHDTFPDQASSLVQAASEVSHAIARQNTELRPAELQNDRPNQLRPSPVREISPARRRVKREHPLRVWQVLLLIVCGMLISELSHYLRSNSSSRPTDLVATTLSGTWSDSKGNVFQVEQRTDSIEITVLHSIGTLTWEKAVGKLSGATIQLTIQGPDGRDRGLSGTVESPKLISWSNTSNWLKTKYGTSAELSRHQD